MAKDFGKFFRDKINSIRLEIARQGSTSDISESHFALEGPSFSDFRLLLACVAGGCVVVEWDLVAEPL